MSNAFEEYTLTDLTKGNGAFSPFTLVTLRDHLAHLLSTSEMKNIISEDAPKRTCVYWLFIKKKKNSLQLYENKEFQVIVLVGPNSSQVKTLNKPNFWEEIDT